MQTKKAYINNSFWITFDTIVKMIGGFFVGVWVANYLGTEDYGILSYSIVFYNMFLIMIELGFNHILVKQIIDKPEKKYTIINTASSIRLIGSILAFIFCNISSFMLIDDWRTRIIILILSFDFFAYVANSYDAFFQAEVKDKFRVIAKTISFSINSLIKIFLIVSEYPLIYFAYAYLVEFIIATTIKGGFYKKLGGTFKFHLDKEIVKILITSSWAIALTAFLNRFVLKLDRLMIGSMLESSDLGIYSASTDIIFPMTTVTSVVSASFIAYLMNLKSKNPELYKLRFNQIFNIITWLGLGVSIVLGLMSEFIFSTLYSDEFFYAHIPFRIGIWELMFSIQISFLNIWLINENKQSFLLYFSLIAAVINIFGNYILINRYGMIGAAISTAGVRVITIWILPIFFNKTREISVISLKSLNFLKLPSSIKVFLSK